MQTILILRDRTMLLWVYRCCHDIFFYRYITIHRQIYLSTYLYIYRSSRSYVYICHKSCYVVQENRIAQVVPPGENLLCGLCSSVGAFKKQKTDTSGNLTIDLSIRSEDTWYTRERSRGWNGVWSFLRSKGTCLLPQARVSLHVYRSWTILG